MSFQNRIHETPTFKGLDSVQVKIYQRTSVKKKIEHNYQMAKLLGVEKWFEVKSPNSFYKNITLDLLKQDKDDTDIKQISS